MPIAHPKCFIFLRESLVLGQMVQSSRLLGMATPWKKKIEKNCYRKGLKKSLFLGLSPYPAPTLFPFLFYPSFIQPHFSLLVSSQFSPYYTRFYPRDTIVYPQTVVSFKASSDYHTWHLLVVILYFLMDSSKYKFYFGTYQLVLYMSVPITDSLLVLINVI